MSNLKKLQFIYGEASENRRLQQVAIEHVNAKINWFVVLNGVLIGFLIQDVRNFFDLITLSFFILSLILLLSTLMLRDYKTGPKLEDMMNKLELSEETIIFEANKKLVKHKVYNDDIISDLRRIMELSTFLLFVGILCLFIKAVLCTI